MTVRCGRRRIEARGYRESSHIPWPLALALLLPVVVCSPLYSASSQEHQNTLLVGVYENPPKVFTSESGKPAGIFIDIIQHVAESEGWTLRYVSGSWREGLDRLETGEIDLMPDVAYTTDRETRFSFHKVPVLSDWFQVYAPRGSGIKSLLDLDGKRITVLEGSIQRDAFNQLAKGFGFSITLVSIPDYKSAFEMVAKGEADAAITNRFYGVTQARTIGLEDTAVVFFPTNLYFAAPKRGPRAVLDTLDTHLSQMKKDPQSIYYKSLKRWVSEEVPVRIPAWLQFVGVVVGVVLLTSLAGSVVLRHQVNVRTRELTQLNQEMDQRIVERTAELASAMHRAEAADRLKSAFLATMSHELRTPLNSIIGFTGILLQRLAGPLNDEQTKQLSMVQGSSRHLLALINDVLDLSKIEAGQLEVVRKPCDMRAIIEQVMRTMLPQAQKKGVALAAAMAPDVGGILSDRLRVEQILLNLLNNAIKFIERGEVRIECRVRGAWLETAVRDTGMGIRAEDLGKLFEPFRQLETGLARRHEGTGLGLSICKRLVELLGGTIRVESVWGEGSTFTFSLPNPSGQEKTDGADDSGHRG